MQVSCMCDLAAENVEPPGLQGCSGDCLVDDIIALNSKDTEPQDLGSWHALVPLSFLQCVPVCSHPWLSAGASWLASGCPRGALPGRTCWQAPRWSSTTSR